MSEQTSTTLACPRCDRLLRRVRIAAERALTQIEVCFGGCGGLWLGPEDLEAGLSSTASDCLLDLQSQAAGLTLTRWNMLEVDQGACPVPPIDFEKWLDCIYCGKGMIRYRWNGNSPVYLDECPEGHGLWVDGGEIQAMRQYQQAEALAPDRACQVKSRLETLARSVDEHPLSHSGHGFLDFLTKILGTPARRF